MRDYEAKMIGEHIRSERQRLGMTQEQLAQEACINQSTLSAYENGAKSPSLHTLARLSEALGSSLDILYYGPADEAIVSRSGTPGRAIANCLYYLWDYGVLSLDDSNCIDLQRFKWPVERLFRILADYLQSLDTFKDRSSYLQQLLNSIAVDIDKEMYTLTYQGFGLRLTDEEGATPTPFGRLIH